MAKLKVLCQAQLTPHFSFALVTTLNTARCQRRIQVGVWFDCEIRNMRSLVEMINTEQHANISLGQDLCFSLTVKRSDTLVGSTTESPFLVHEILQPVRQITLFSLASPQI